jgi:hypothetical protein
MEGSCLSRRRMDSRKARDGRSSRREKMRGERIKVKNGQPARNEKKGQPAK